MKIGAGKVALFLQASVKLDVCVP